MIPLRYWFFRTLRRHTPQWLVDAMLDRSIYLRPGRDTRAPGESVRALAAVLERQGKSLVGGTLCVVGSGGGYGIGVHLLEAGAGQVLLQEPFAPERVWRNNVYIDASLLEKYMQRDGKSWTPRDQRLVLVRDHLYDYAARCPQSVDFIYSNSVLEHVAELGRLVAASARLVRPDGHSVHFVDLRDHYFRYPFEMRCYSEHTWQRWLNASNTLNRLRLPDYEEVFRRHFHQVNIEILESLPDAFTAAKPRIRPEFLTGDDRIDSASIIRIEAAQPR